MFSHLFSKNSLNNKVHLTNKIRSIDHIDSLLQLCLDRRSIIDTTRFFDHNDNVEDNTMNRSVHNKRLENRNNTNNFDQIHLDNRSNLSNISFFHRDKFVRRLHFDHLDDEDISNPMDHKENSMDNNGYYLDNTFLDERDNNQMFHLSIDNRSFLLDKYFPHFDIELNRISN